MAPDTQSLLTEEGTAATLPGPNDQLDSHLHGWPLFQVALSIGALVFLSGLETSFVIISSSTIAADLGGMDSAPFLGTCFLLAATVTAPVQARLSDSIGRKPVIIGASVIFALGTLLCAIAPTMNLLLMARSVTGVGSGGMGILSSIILSESVPRRSRAFWHAIGNLIAGSAVALGGPFGGLLAALIGWRCAFAALLPFSIISICIAAAFLLPSAYSGCHRTSLLSDLGLIEMITVSTSILTLFLSLSFLASRIGVSLNSTDITFVALGLSVSLISTVFLVYIETRAPHPIIDIRTLLQRDMGSICLLNFLSSLSYQATLYATPYFLIVVKNESPAAAGLRLLPVSAAAVCCSVACGAVVAKTGKFRGLLVAGSFMPILGLVSLFIDAHSARTSFLSTLMEFTGLVLSAVGQQTVSALSMVALLCVCNKSSLARGTSLVALSKSFGGVVGTALSGILLQVRLSSLPRKAVRGTDAETIIRTITSSADLISTLPDDIQTIAHSAWRQSFAFVFLVLCGVPFFAWAVSSLVKEESAAERSPADRIRARKTGTPLRGEEHRVVVEGEAPSP